MYDIILISLAGAENARKTQSESVGIQIVSCELDRSCHPAGPFLTHNRWPTGMRSRTAIPCSLFRQHLRRRCGSWLVPDPFFRTGAALRPSVSQALRGNVQYDSVAGGRQVPAAPSTPASPGLPASPQARFRRARKASAVSQSSRQSSNSLKAVGSRIAATPAHTVSATSSPKRRRTS